MLDDAELMKRTAAGDERAFRDLVERHGRAVHTFFLRVVRSVEDAEDLTQELFIALFRSAGRYRPDAPFSSYLYRIASNMTASHLRRRSARPSHSLDALTETGFEAASERHNDRPDRSYEEREMRQRYERALERLPADWRIALELRVGRELSYGEIASAMGKSIPAVESILVRARERIAAEMGRGGRRE